MPDFCWKCEAPPTALADELPMDTPPIDFSQLLASNDSPLFSHIPSIRQTVTFSRLRVDALDAQIDALRATMEQLIEERDETAERVEQYTAILSPVRRVPAELICEIFSWTSPRPRKIGENSVAQPPWHLGHICRSWRDTALGNTLLWNSISILHSSRHPHQNTFPLSMIETQLFRSANTPLVLDFDWDQMVSGDSLLLALLVLHCERWSSMRVNPHIGTLFDLLQP